MCRLPTPVTQGYYTLGTSSRTKSYQVPCEAGRWCTGGLPYDCNAGFYGDQRAQSDPGLQPAVCLQSLHLIMRSVRGWVF
jgi:hypothetical protein